MPINEAALEAYLTRPRINEAALDSYLHIEGVKAKHAGEPGITPSKRGWIESEPATKAAQVLTGAGKVGASTADFLFRELDKLTGQQTPSVAGTLDQASAQLAGPEPGWGDWAAETAGAVPAALMPLSKSVSAFNKLPGLAKWAKTALGLGTGSALIAPEGHRMEAGATGAAVGAALPGLSSLPMWGRVPSMAGLGGAASAGSQFVNTGETPDIGQMLRDAIVMGGLGFFPGAPRAGKPFEARAPNPFNQLPEPPIDVPFTERPPAAVHPADRPLPPPQAKLAPLGLPEPPGPMRRTFFMGEPPVEPPVPWWQQGPVPPEFTVDINQLGPLAPPVRAELGQDVPRPVPLPPKDWMNQLRSEEQRQKKPAVKPAIDEAALDAYLAENAVPGAGRGDVRAGETPIPKGGESDVPEVQGQGRAAAVAPTPKEPWEMSFEEFVESGELPPLPKRISASRKGTLMGEAMRIHRSRVKEAVDSGKPVPTENLQRYGLELPAPVVPEAAGAQPLPKTAQTDSMPRMLPQERERILKQAEDVPFGAVDSGFRTRLDESIRKNEEARIPQEMRDKYGVLGVNEWQENADFEAALEKKGGRILAVSEFNPSQGVKPLIWGEIRRITYETASGERRYAYVMDKMLDVDAPAQKSLITKKPINSGDDFVNIIETHARNFGRGEVAGEGTDYPKRWRLLVYGSRSLPEQRQRELKRLAVRLALGEPLDDAGKSVLDDTYAPDIHNEMVESLRALGENIIEYLGGDGGSLAENTPTGGGVPPASSSPSSPAPAEPAPQPAQQVQPQAQGEVVAPETQGVTPEPPYIPPGVQPPVETSKPPVLEWGREKPPKPPTPEPPKQEGQTTSGEKWTKPTPLPRHGQTGAAINPAEAIVAGAQKTKEYLRPSRHFTFGQAETTGLADTPVSKPTFNKLVGEIVRAKPSRASMERQKHEERVRRAAIMHSTLKRTGGGEAAVGPMKGVFKGEYPRVAFDPIGHKFTQGERNELFNHIWTSQVLGERKIMQKTALASVLKNILDHGYLPTEGEISNLEAVFGPDLAKALLSKQSLGNKVWRWAKEALNTPRTMVASADLSAVLRQGFTASIAHPKLGSESFLLQLEAFRDKDYAEGVDNSFRIGDQADVREDAGLELPSFQGGNVDLTAREEYYMSHLIQRLGDLQGKTREGKVIAFPLRQYGRLVRGSERAYVTYLNNLRARTFDLVDAQLKKAGLTEDQLEFNRKQLARLLNAATGRGNLNTHHYGELSNAIFFSPKFFVSRFEAPIRAAVTAARPGVAAPLRKEAVRELIPQIFLWLTVGALIKVAAEAFDFDMDFGIDPRSSDFLKVRLGKTRIDLGAGYGQPARLVARTAMRETVDAQGRVRKTDPLEEGKRFILYKLAPVPAAATAIVRGKTAIGKPVTAGEVAKSLLVPIPFQTVKEVWDEHGALGLALMAPELLGAGVSVYEDRDAERPRPARPKRPMRPARPQRYIPEP